MTIVQLRDWVDSHMEKPCVLPVPVSDLTPREYKIFLLLAADRGFLKFLQTHLHLSQIETKPEV